MTNARDDGGRSPTPNATPAESAAATPLLLMGEDVESSLEITTYDGTVICTLEPDV